MLFICSPFEQYHKKRKVCIRLSGTVQIAHCFVFPDKSLIVISTPLLQSFRNDSLLQFFDLFIRKIIDAYTAIISSSFILEEKRKPCKQGKKGSKNHLSIVLFFLCPFYRVHFETGKRFCFLLLSDQQRRAGKAKP